MSEKPVRSTDELFVDFNHVVDRLDILQNLMLDHTKACGENVTTQTVNFFSDQIGKVVFDMYEYLNDIKLAMDVEAHRKI